MGHKNKVPVFLDEEVLSHDYVWCGGGARSKLAKLRTKDIVKLSIPTVCDISIGYPSLSTANTQHVNLTEQQFT